MLIFLYRDNLIFFTFALFLFFLKLMPLSGLEIKPHQLTPLLATPRTLALAFAGAATYIGFVDPKVRNEL
jgi:hypothetical protein